MMPIEALTSRFDRGSHSFCSILFGSSSSGRPSKRLLGSSPSNPRDSRYSLPPIKAPQPLVTNIASKRAYTLGIILNIRGLRVFCISRKGL